MNISMKIILGLIVILAASLLVALSARAEDAKVRLSDLMVVLPTLACTEVEDTLDGFHYSLQNSTSLDSGSDFYEQTRIFNNRQWARTINNLREPGRACILIDSPQQEIRVMAKKYEHHERKPGTNSAKTVIRDEPPTKNVRAFLCVAWPSPLSNSCVWIRVLL